LAEDKKVKKKEEGDPVSRLKSELESIRKNKDIPIDQKDKKINSKISSYLKSLEIPEDPKKADIPKLQVLRTLSKKDLDTFVPKPHKTFLLINEKYNENIEPTYFWVLGFMKDDLKIGDVQKIVDTYSASEASAFAKSMGQSLSAIQDRVVATMKGVSQLVKELFQIVREVRVLKEKLDLYRSGEKGDDAAEISLKGQYVDLVEGGAQSPSSVYSLATKVGFAILPDLFFRTHIFDKTKVNEKVEKMPYNEKIKEVLKRKLRAYAGWRESTKMTLEYREKFTIKFLRTHYNAIMMNLQWLKPYLKMTRRMALKPGVEERPELLAAIEQAYMEIELLACREPSKVGKYIAVSDVEFTFRTNPEMMYDQQMQYRKPSHTGRVEMKVMARAMTTDQILAYRVSKEVEDFELLGSISKSIEDSIQGLGDDLKKYLKEAGEEKFPEDAVVKVKEEKGKLLPGLEPFTAIFSGFKELGESLFGFSKWNLESGKKDSEYSSKTELDAAKAKATGDAFKIFWIFKKSHLMITW
jgi:hypothetical protein